MASSYLLVGPSGVGKRLFAAKLGEALLCQAGQRGGWDPCGSCRSCQLMQAGNHPDWEYIGLPEGKKTIPVELFIGDRQHRGRAGLCHWLAMKPYLGRRRIGVIDDADQLSDEDANCLLKTLEEPPPGSVLLLLGTSPDRQLPTIRSRCQLIRFRPLEDGTLADLLLAAGQVADRGTAQRLAGASGGSLERARQLSDPEVWQFRADFLHGMARQPLDSLGLSRAIAGFVEAAGKESAVKRQRAALVVDWAVELWSAVLRLVTGATRAGQLAEETLCQAARTLAAGPDCSVDQIMSRLDRCWAAEDHIQRNAHLAIVVESWLNDLAQLAVGGHPA